MADLSLAGVNLIWGATFVTMKSLLGQGNPLNILFWRFLIATLFLIFFLPGHKPDKKTLRNGGILGMVLFSGYLFQTIGLVYTTPSRSAFITGLSVILVPLFSWLILKTSLRRVTLVGIFLALAGLSLMTLNSGELTGFALKGDLLTLLGAIAYALQIVLVERFTGESQSFPLASTEMITVVLLIFLLAIPFRAIRFSFSAVEFGQITFLGIAATGLAFAIQNVAQKHTTAIHVGLIFVLEPVFAAICSYIFWHEKLTPRTLAGCLLIMGGILISVIKPGVLFYSPASRSSIFKLNSKPST
ncbi:MAG: DMT family transporter [Atribacterota bacterium]